MPALVYIFIIAISGCNTGYSSGNAIIADEGALWELFGGLLLLGGLFLFRGGYDPSKNNDRDELNDDEIGPYD